MPKVPLKHMEAAWRDMSALPGDRIVLAGGEAVFDVRIIEASSLHKSRTDALMADAAGRIDAALKGWQAGEYREIAFPDGFKVAALCLKNERWKRPRPSAAPLGQRAWERRLRIIGRLMPRKERARIFEPLIEELHEDFLHARRACRTRNDRRLMKAVYLLRIASIIVSCVIIAARRRAASVIPTAWRAAMVSAIAKALARSAGG